MGTGADHGRIYRSTDHGTTWTNVFSPWAWQINAVFIDNNLGLASTDDSCYRSTDAGITWSAVHQNLEPLAFTASNGVLFAGTSGGGVFRSSNNGSAWTRADSGMGAQHVYALAGLGAEIFAGPLSGGVHRSTNLGISWTPEGFPLNQAYSLFIKDSILYAGVYSEGVWTRDLHRNPLAVSGQEKEPLPSTCVLHQNFPNPFNPGTSLSYEIPANGHVTLKVFDLLGREVITLVDGVEESGKHSVSFDATGLAGGVYYCRLQTNQNTITKKMLLVK